MYCKFVSTFWWRGLGKMGWSRTEALWVLSLLPPTTLVKLSSPLAWTTAKARQLFFPASLLFLCNSFCTQVRTRKLIISFSCLVSSHCSEAKAKQTILGYKVLCGLNPSLCRASFQSLCASQTGLQNLSTLGISCWGPYFYLSFSVYDFLSSPLPETDIMRMHFK